MLPLVQAFGRDERREAGPRMESDRQYKKIFQLWQKLVAEAQAGNYKELFETSFENRFSAGPLFCILYEKECLKSKLGAFCPVGGAL